ncbi:MAG: LEA type 2 family protein [Chitinophagales bacterium]
MKKSMCFYLVVVLILSSCREPKELAYQSIQNLSMEQGAKPSVTLDIRMYNPNHYNLKLKNADVDVFLNETNMGKLRVNGQHSAPGLDTFLLPVTLDMNPQIALPNILQLIMKGEVKIKLAGAIKGGRHGIYVRVPVNYEGTENLLSSMK